MDLRPYFKYLQAILRHKYFVFLEACKLGIPWLGLIHDLSKFLPCEFIPYARWFYGKRLIVDHGDERMFKKGDTVEIGNGKAETYWYVDRVRPKRLILAPVEAKTAFDRAWNHHQKHNKHHWQYWVLMYDHPELEPEILLDMPDRYRVEMLADWRGAGRAYGNPDTKGWYAEHKDHQRVHPSVKAWLAEWLE